MAAPSAGIVAGITTSTPYGRPPVLASIQSSTLSSSAASLKRTQPSTPSPPARLIAAATCSDGVNPKIGCSMPSCSHSAVRMAVSSGCGSRAALFRGRSDLLLCVPTRPRVVGLARRCPADLLHQPDRPRHLVPGDLAAKVGIESAKVNVAPVAQLY